MIRDKIQITPNALLSFGVALALFGLISGETRLWGVEGPQIVTAFRYWLIPAALLVLIAYAKNNFILSGLKVTPYHFSAILLVIFASDFLCRGYSFLRGPSIRGTIIMAALIAALFMLKSARTWVNWLALIVPIVLTGEFLLAADGRLIFSDDHPSVLYRLQLLKDNFPMIPFYNPQWNAGMDARDFFATGALNIFFPFAPLIYLFDLPTVYNLIISLILFVVLPGSLYLACKIEELPDPAPAIAALLGISSSLVWYRWGLKYGAMGFMMSASLLPFNLAMARKILEPKREISIVEALAFTVTVTLLLFWPLAGAMLIPAFLYGALTLWQVQKKRFVKGIITFLLLLNIPWMVMFFSVSQVNTFVSLKRPVIENRDQGLSESVEVESATLNERVVRYQRWKLSPKGVIHTGREFFEKANPLLLLAIPGLFLLGGFSRRIYLLHAGWLLLLGTVVTLLKPQLELERMLIALSLVLSVPAALAIADLIKRPRPLLAVTLGFLIAGIFSATFTVRNRSIEQYRFADPLVAEMSRAIGEHGGDGRVVFTGFMLHQVSSGHIAPLTVFSKKPLVASSPFHNLWWYTDLIPASFSRRKKEGIEQFLDLKNASAVMAHEPKWKEYFRSYPERYQPVWQSEGFVLFKRDTALSYFLEGAGEILEQGDNKLRFKLASERAVLKFNYFPFVTVSGCLVSPFDAGDGVSLVQLSSCPVGSELVLASVNPLQRLLNG